MNKETQKAISIDRLKSGDRAEFASLVERYSDLIYRLAIKMLGNEQDAEDVLQETFLKAFRSIGSFQGNAHISTWLYRIATNEALMLIRKGRPESSHVQIEEDVESEENPSLQIVDWGSLPEDQLLSSESIHYLNRLIQSLTPALRIVFILRDVMDQSVQETAEVLGISESAVKTRLSRARLKLRQELSEYYRKNQLNEGIFYAKD